MFSALLRMLQPMVSLLCLHWLRLSDIAGEQVGLGQPLLDFGAVVVVQPGELAEQINCVIVISNRSVSLAFEITYVNEPVVMFNLSSPFAFESIPENSFITAGAVGPRPLIERVLLRRAQTKIGFAIIKAVVIDMVAVHTQRCV